MRLIEIDPPVFVVGALLLIGAGFTLMYAQQRPIRIAGGLLASGVALLAFGWLGLLNFWLVTGVLVLFGSAKVRPLFRPAPAVA